MSMDERITELLVQHEGMRLKPYKCTAGKLTIGVGRNLDDVGITNYEAMALLKNDIARVKQELYGNLPYFEALDETRQVVLIDMCFNLGISRLLKFKKMFLALNAGLYDVAASEMLDSRWAKQVGKRALELSIMMKGG